MKSKPKSGHWRAPDSRSEQGESDSTAGATLPADDALALARHNFLPRFDAGFATEAVERAIANANRDRAALLARHLCPEIRVLRLACVAMRSAFNVHEHLRLNKGDEQSSPETRNNNLAHLCTLIASLDVWYVAAHNEEVGIGREGQLRIARAALGDPLYITDTRAGTGFSYSMSISNMTRFSLLSALLPEFDHSLDVDQPLTKVQTVDSRLIHDALGIAPGDTPRVLAGEVIVRGATRLHRKPLLDNVHFTSRDFQVLEELIERIYLRLDEVDEWWTLGQAQERTGIPKATITNWVEDGTIPKQCFRRHPKDKDPRDCDKNGKSSDKDGNTGNLKEVSRRGIEIAMGKRKRD